MYEQYEYPSDRFHYDENLSSNIKRFIMAIGPCRPDIVIPFKDYENGKSFRFSTQYYTKFLKSDIKVPRFWL